MPRLITVASAQLGPIEREESKTSVVKRMTDMMRHAHGRGARLVVYPEMALTTFFPRWHIEDEAELDAFYETEMPSAETQSLFDLSKELGVGFYLGYSEMFFDDDGKKRRFNTAILVNQQAEIIGKYRKVHLPGHDEFDPDRKFQHLEKRYFEVGDLGFGTWRTMGGVMGMCICNDRRWPETYRVLSLKGAELVLLGYNTPSHIPWDPTYDDLAGFHNHLVMQAGAYQNGTWVVGVAKAGDEEDCNLIGGSAIVAPSGEIVALCSSKDDELISAVCDLEICVRNKDAMFSFEAHRRIEHYGVITGQTGVTPPD